MKLSISEIGRAIGRPAIRALGTATAQSRQLPDFLVIGGKRCGSTSLYYGLLQHPGVMAQFPEKGILPVRENRKGVHYFDHQSDRSERWYRGHFPNDRRRRRATNAAGGAVTGEATPWYLFAPGAAGHAARVVPHARIIVILRDPVDRAHSHFLEQRRRGHEPLASFDDALDAEAARCRDGVVDGRGRARSAAFAHEHLTYTLQGEYDVGLAAWLEHFPAERLLGLRSEDFFADAPATLATASRFLGLGDHTFAVERRNATTGAEATGVALHRLEAHYRSHVECLEDMLGRSMGWKLSGLVS